MSIPILTAPSIAGGPGGLPSVSASSSAKSGVSGDVTTSFASGDFIVGSGAKKGDANSILWAAGGLLLGSVLMKAFMK